MNLMTHRARKSGTLGAAAVLVLALAGGCKPMQFEADSNIPAPLIDRIPVVVAVHIPKEFREKVYAEKRSSGSYSISLGKAQTDGFLRMMQAMFARVVTVDSVEAAAAADAEIRGVLVPVLDDYAFVTPADSGTSSYAATLKYTVSLYSPRGELKESWTFTGYGSQTSNGFPGSGDDALKAATSRAMRDAAAKLAAEFRDQAIARGLLPQEGAAGPAEVTTPLP
jgi:hypothetical protein